MSCVSTRRGSSLSSDPIEAVNELRAAIDQPGIRAVFLFCSASYDLKKLGRAIRDAFDCPVVGCTSAGQIGPGGYQRGGITAASLASEELSVHGYLISPLSRCGERAAHVGAQVRARLAGMSPRARAFGLLLVDGLSLAEERLAAALYQRIGNVPIVGGSAGDDLRFESTAVYWDGEFLPDAALFSIVETSIPFSTFKLQSFQPSDRKLVTTAADPERRLVKELNGRPAAEAYAELVGVPAEGLDARAVSRNPVMLRIGSDYYVRSIQKVNPDQSLSFFCAIEEGLVLRVGEALDPLAALERGFDDAVREMGPPSLVFGCDCILRRLDFEQRGIDERVGEYFSSRGVVGFSTYGEQFNGVHINQTFVGVALAR